MTLLEDWSVLSVHIYTRSKSFYMRSCDILQSSVFVVTQECRPFTTQNEI